MRKKSRFRRVTCRRCGEKVTTNALGRASHDRKCSGANEVFREFNRRKEEKHQ